MRAILLLSVMSTPAVMAGADDQVDYRRDIKPLFAAKCGSCHGALKRHAELRLDAGRLILKGSENGAVVAPGKPADSLLIEKISAEDPDERMPPEGEGEPLNARQIALVTAWIQAGAISPEDEETPADPREHWAYQQPARPLVPTVADERWRGPIDAFIAAKHQQMGLKPVGDADGHTLLRRAYFDLIGLPPTREQIDEFTKNDSARAWPDLVDSLLESPHYGERWGRHWMDVWRYSDWDGYKQQLRGSSRHIWRWRDWIVDSLNADKGYDRMIVEMLAGDEVAPADRTVLPATGFLARNFHKSNRNIWLDAAVEHTAKAFLGMTLNCARCHDHKYDPIDQTAYYQFRAVFEPHNIRTERVPGQPNVMQDGLPRAFDAELEAKTFLYLRGNDKRPDKENPMSPGVPEVLGGAFEPRAVSLPVEAWYPALTKFVLEEQLAAARKQLAVAKEKLTDAAPNENASEDGSDPAGQDDSPNRLVELQLAVADRNLKSLEARLAADRAKFAAEPRSDEQVRQLATLAATAERELNLSKAELAVAQKTAALTAAESSGEKDEKKKKAAVDKASKELADATAQFKKAQAALKTTDAKYTPLGKEHPRTSSGRRLALARWIASRDNPLTARVAVNHIWMRHFGQPLVENVFDFGLRTPKPGHAELLDWLAVELMENNWSMKHLHRLILNSQTWRMASSASTSAAENNRQIDSDNRWLWRASIRRLDAEIVRDNVLAVSGQLDPQFGGADIDFRKGEESKRRSIYLRHAYEKQMTMLVLFDAASPNECYRRSESIIPQQALALSNSSLVLSGSRMLARQIWSGIDAGESTAEAEFVRHTFLHTLSRPPEDDEIAVCLEFLSNQAATLSDPSKLKTFAGGSAAKVKSSENPKERARENLVHVLMNHNDFVTTR